MDAELAVEGPAWDFGLKLFVVGRSAPSGLDRPGIGRKNYLFFGSDVGGETAAVLYTFTQTCRTLDIEPWHYLRDVLERLPSHPPERLANLLPEEWAQTQRGVAEAASLAPTDELVPSSSG